MTKARKQVGASPKRERRVFSDEFKQYACGAYRARLAPRGIEASMSRKGDSWDNAVAESFFATLELELITRHRWATRSEARQAIFRYIETWYNLRRRHSTLGYCSPVATSTVQASRVGSINPRYPRSRGKPKPPSPPLSPHCSHTEPQRRETSVRGLASERSALIADRRPHGNP
jgi:hypothetical protein